MISHKLSINSNNTSQLKKKKKQLSYEANSPFLSRIESEKTFVNYCLRTF